MCLAAGFGFATSAHDSRGTDLRAPNTGNLAGLVRSAEAEVRAEDKTLSGLQAQVSAATQQAGTGNSAVARAQARVAPLKDPGGLTPMHGPGIEVVLDDAPGQIAGVDPNQLVVHQSDLQGVVNALWAGGAEAMSIAGQRVIATSAVRCVGNTLLLNGDVYSPPFRVVAIGPATQLQRQLDASPAVTLFKQAAEFYGLGYTVDAQAHVEVPAYTRPIGLIYARPLSK
ncbi:MAG TPA: DUF881 domain-containing protein [Jatrophihabitantaceae bacterium]|nr:DUF881 domain-containing protein [Jatrophihabitantaceae bacterium]